jgi:two-component system, NarL family, response regulator NreC
MPAPMARDPHLTVVVADHHVVVREGLCLLLDSLKGIEVVGEAGDVASALAEVERHRPDVLVMEPLMQGQPGLGAIRQVGETSPDTRVVILTAQEDPNLAGEAIRGGAAAYVPKTAAGRQLLRAIRMAAEGNTYLEPQLGARLAADVAAAKLAAPELTERELEVLRLIARGHTNRETAERLFLSVRTVENHRARLQRKLGRASRSDLVDYVIERRLVEPAEILDGAS